MATKITTRVLADDAVTDAKIADVTLTTATQAASDNTTKIATTAYVTTAIANLADSAPSTLNTLNELAAALGDDANFSTTVTNSIAGKLPLAGGTMTGNITSNESTFSIFNNDIRFKTSGAETMLRAVGNGAVELMHNNVTRVATSADGATITGKLLIGADSGDAFNDDAMLRLQRTGDRVFQQFKCDADQNIQILFGDVDDDVESSIQYYPADKNLIFTTGNNAEAMRIDSSQNVGIGTGSSSINAPLEISGAVAMAGGWGRSMVLRHNFPTIVWQSEYSTDAYAGIGYDNTTGMHFMVNSPTVDVFANSQKSAMFIRDDKRIGIGTTSPTAKLEISGKDDAEGTTDLLALQFDNSPADTGMTFRDIFDGIQARFTLDSGNTNNLRISSGSTMHFYGGTSNGTGNGHLLINSSGHVGIVAGKRFYLDNASIASGDTYIDEYSANEVGITTGGSRKFALSGGNLYHTGSLNSNHNFSDERLKENIVVIPNALEKVNTLRGITFNRKSDGSVGTGLIAQELETVLPEAVYESKTIDSLEVPDAEEYKAIRYGTTVGLLVEAIKELTTKLEAAEARITTLEG